MRRPHSAFESLTTAVAFISATTYLEEKGRRTVSAAVVAIGWLCERKTLEVALQRQPNAAPRRCLGVAFERVWRLDGGALDGACMREVTHTCV